MKSILITFILVLNFNTLKFDKNTVSYSRLIPLSELIVEGNIKSLSDSSFEFLVTDFIKGNEKMVIKVKKWREWQCDMRHAKYELGQRLILILTRNEDGIYEAMNGSTGELIINKDESIERYSYRALPKLPITKEGIKMIITAINFEGDMYTYSEEKYKFTILVSKSEFERLRNNNEFFYLATRGLSFGD
ncbi:hypothetical protein [Olleya sp. Bg11-27]|uniref:hypothetical protein n=1 Tax=Olleya sp. Bg11-27 TaxID=2058135 RepID=UPI000C3130AB|nr:hypothetical protein [Olleya sp. Bg11-27]AUC77086.1 hypothetical protein CW732_15940 [Olleya sp. Bg11-27]